jgi:hypothetical protein
MYNLNYTQKKRWRFKVEEKLYLGVREQKRLNNTDLAHADYRPNLNPLFVLRSDILLQHVLDSSHVWAEYHIGQLFSGYVKRNHSSKAM